MTNNTTPDLRTALIEARDWFESQAKAVSKGCGSSYELHDLRVQRDALDAALTAQAQTVAHDALRCAVGNCKFNGKVDKHATGCSAAASNEEALLKALTEATRSLETIQLMAGKDDYLQDMAQVRAYATSRAMVANAAIADFKDASAQTADECPHGSKHIVRDCMRCGAPVCCGKCCAEDAQAAECGNCFEGKSDMDHDCRKCGGSGAAQAAPVDAAVQALIDSAPAPFRRLGELLASTLDEDQWATAQSLLLGGLVAVQEGRDIQGDIDHYNENMG